MLPGADCGTALGLPGLPTPLVPVPNVPQGTFFAYDPPGSYTTIVGDRMNSTPSFCGLTVGGAVDCWDSGGPL